MSTEALKLGVDSSEVKQASGDLAKLTAEAKKTEKASDDLSRQFAKTGAAIGANIAGALTAVVAITKAYIDYADALDEASQRTGIAANDLAGLEFAAAQSGTSLAKLEQMLGRVSDKAADAASGSKAAAAVFDTMGIKVTNSNGALKGQEELLVAIADKFASYKDGTEKAALAQELFGRGGRELIPLLNKGSAGIEELKAKYRELGGITSDAAARLNAFNDRMDALHSQVTIATGQFVQGLLPALNQVATAVENLTKSTGGFKDAGQVVGEVIASLSNFAIRGAAALTALGTAIGASAAAAALVAKGQFGAALQTMRDMVAEIDGLKERAERAIAVAEALRKQEQAGLVGAANYDQNDRRLQSAGGAAPIIQRATAAASEYARMLQTVREKQAEVEQGIARAFDTTPIMDAEKELTKLVNSDAFKKLSSGQQIKLLVEYNELIESQKELARTKAAIEQVIAAEKELASLREELAAIEAKHTQAADATLDALIQQRDTLIEEGRAIGLTKTQLDALTLSRLDEKIAALEEKAANGELTSGLYAQLEVLKQIRAQTAANQAAQNAAQQAADYRNAWVDAFQSIDDSARQTFTDMLNGSRDAVQRLTDTIKNLLYNALYQLTVRPFIVNIVAAISGVSANSLTGGGGGGGGLDLVSMLFGGKGGGGGGFGGFNFGDIGGLSTLFSGLGGSFATSGLGSALGLSSSVFELTGASSMALTGAGTGLVTAMGMIGTAMPYIAAALAIANALGAFDHGGPKGGGYASTPGLDLGDAFKGDNNRYFTPNNADADMQKVVDATQSTFDTIFRKLGGQGNGGFGFALGYDTDPQGTANNRAHVGAWVNGKQVYDYQSGDDALGKDPAALQAAIELETKRAMLAALQNSDLPDYISTILNSLDAATASSEDIDNITKFAEAFKNLYEFLGNADPMADAQKLLENASKSSIEQLSDAAAQLREMGTNFDGTTGAVQDLTQATAAYYNQLVKTLAQIQQIKTGLARMFDDTRTDLTLSTLSDAQKRIFYEEDARRARELISQSNSPEEIQRLLERINEDIRKAWDLMTPEQQQAALAEQLRLMDEVQAEADARLDEIATTLEDAGKQTLDDMRKLLSDFVDSLKEGNTVIVDASKTNSNAAATQLQAANINLRAANTPIKVEVTTDGVANG